MATVELEHADLAKHQVGMMQQLRNLWLEGHGCDVVLKSHDGAEHRAHTTLLSAASVYFKNLLSGSFVEADQVQRKQPVELAASKAAVSASLDFIYGGLPKVPLDTALELLRLGEAYDLPKFASAIEAGIRTSIDGITALQVLQEMNGLHGLKATCEEKVAEDFEACSQHPDFGKLSAGQLARILKRDDLTVSREEVVLKGIFNWLKVSKDRSSLLCMLLQHVDFGSFSVENLVRLGTGTLSGANAADLHREVDEALQCRKRKRGQGVENSDHFQPKRRCLKHWSPDFGASDRPQVRKVLQTPFLVACWHQGAIHFIDAQSDKVIRWKPGDPATATRLVLGQGAGTAGINDLGGARALAIKPTGEILVLYVLNEQRTRNFRLMSYQNGFGRLILGDMKFRLMCCSPSGVVYVSDCVTIQKLVGSNMETVIDMKNLPEDLRFLAQAVFVTEGEVIYFIDGCKGRIFRLDPAQSLEPVVVAQIPSAGELEMRDLSVTEDGTIYVCEYRGGKVWVFHAGDPTPTEVLQCSHPLAILVKGRCLYVSLLNNDPTTTGVPGVFEYLLPPELQLE